mmetsp:Transcript_35236/g.81539  ORF Transcript_35236/g.81539 Transcript_35236/m.81539 type:complete len:648 (+) Transcript_35236:57-2000(+)
MLRPRNLSAARRLVLGFLLGRYGTAVVGGGGLASDRQIYEEAIRTHLAYPYVPDNDNDNNDGDYESISSQGGWFPDAEVTAAKVDEPYEEIAAYGNGPVVTEGRRKFWDLFAKIDDGKTNSRIYKTGPDGRPRLEKFKYIILPIWWSDMNVNDPVLRMDPAICAAIIDRNIEYYRRMSFDSIELSYQVLPQTRFPISGAEPKFGDTQEAATAIVDATGYAYDGIILNYHLARAGPFDGHGGWGNVNGPFMWQSYKFTYYVTRHEIGHNFGHPHHESMRGYRECEKECALYDEFDMMSGKHGIVQEVSDYHVASKWFFGWVPDSSVLMLQPEGPTASCPRCQRSVSRLRLKTFDRYDLPPGPGDVLGVHIPAFGATVKNKEQVHSYWLQYRSGNDAKLGLSIHATWFKLTGKTFGASYHQFNYDARGDTVSYFDQFVVPGECYTVLPAVVFMEIDPHAAEQILPRVCVHSLDEGSHLTISVSFLDPGAAASHDPGAVEEIVCRRDGAAHEGVASAAAGQLYRFVGTGDAGRGHGGELGVTVCPDSARADSRASVYFYDRYPHNVVDLGEPPGFGAFNGTSVGAPECCAPGSDLVVAGARVVMVRQNEDYVPVELNEIQVFDADGINVAPAATCYCGFSAQESGPPSCL